MKNDITKELVESLINIAEQEVIAEFEQKATPALLRLQNIKKFLPYMDLSSPLVRINLQIKGILDTPPFVVVDNREAKR